MKLKKNKPDRDPEYREFVRTFNCCICGSGEVVAHHVEHAGLGLKGSDFSCIPLCGQCHNKIHTGEYSGKFEDVQIKVLRTYIRKLKQKS